MCDPGTRWNRAEPKMAHIRILRDDLPNAGSIITQFNGPLQIDARLSALIEATPHKRGPGIPHQKYGRSFGR